eukprot:236327_1
MNIFLPRSMDNSMMLKKLLQLKEMELLNTSNRKKILISTGSVIASFIIRYLYCKIDRKIKKLPNGPCGVPVFGSLLQVLSDPIKFFKDRFDQDGELSCFYFGSFNCNPIIMINSANAANIILKNKFATGRNPYLEPLNMGFPIPSRFAFIDYTNDCKYRRKIFKHQLLAQINTTYFENNVHNAMREIFFKSLNDKIAKNKLFFPRKEMFHIVFLTIFQNVFGNNITVDITNEKYIEFDRLLQEYAQIGNLMTLTGLKLNFNHTILKYLDTKFGYAPKALKIYNIYNYWMQNAVGFKYDLVNNKIIYKSENDKQTLLNDKQFTYIQALIKEYYDGKIDARTVYSDMNMAFQAGIETTANTMDFILCTLAKYPSIQQQIYNELYTNSNDNENINIISIKQLNECDILRMFIYECIRLSCIVSTSVPRRLMETIKYKNYILPKNAEIMLNMKACNIYCQEWRNGIGLNLENWKDENGKFKYNKNLMSFGVGSRECIGKAIAMKSLLYYTANIVLSYKIDGPTGDSNFCGRAQRVRYFARKLLSPHDISNRQKH